MVKASSGLRAVVPSTSASAGAGGCRMSSGDSGGCLPSSSTSGAASPASSVASDDLQALLNELNIVPPGFRPLPNKRRLVDSDSEAVSSPSACRPHYSPRLDTGNGPPTRPGAAQAVGSVAAAAAAAAAPQVAAAIGGRRPAVQQQQQQAQPAPEPEVIELLDSTSDSESDYEEEEESEEEWSIAAPSTVTKRRQQVVDSEEESDEERDEGSASASSSQLPAFFAAIPSLAAAAPRQQAATAVASTAATAPWAPPSVGGVPRNGTQQRTAAAAAPPRQVPCATGDGGPGPTATAARPMSASAFKRQREELARQLFHEYNRTVFEGRLPPDLEIRWNSRLLTTAGLTHYRRDIPDDPYAPPIYSAHVELSAKVLDGFAKLERTLCHELCHVAAWLVDHTAKPPHGPVFKAWARRAMTRYPHLDITTCHGYEIFYPFRWQCSNAECLTSYGRHSNSIDVTKKVCGACRAPLLFLGKFKPDGTPAKARAPSKYSQFVKENLAGVKAALPAGTPQKVVMQHLSVRYAAALQQQQQQGQQQAAEAQPSASSGGSIGAGGVGSYATSSLLGSLNLQA